MKIATETSEQEEVRRSLVPHKEDMTSVQDQSQ